MQILLTMGQLEKVKALSIIYFLIIVVNIGFAFSAFFACNKCYITPCEQGNGLDVMYRVDQGKGFQAVTSALLFFLQAVLCLRQLNKTPTPPPMTMGLLMGSTLLAFVVILEAMSFWASELDMIERLHGRFIESGRISTPNTSAIHVFTAITTFASLLFVLYLVQLALLFKWKDDIMSNPTTDSGAYYEEGVASGVGSGDGQGLHE